MRIADIPGKNKLILLGSGGHCSSVLDVALRMNTFSEIVITDNNLSAGENILGCKIVGTDDVLQGLWENGFLQAFITVGSIKDTKLRRHIYRKVKDIGFDFPLLVDPSAVVASSAKIGQGVFIGKNTVVNTSAMIGDMAIINTGAIIEHDCQIGSFSHIAVGAVICGSVEIESDVFVGANATIIQGVKIGINSVIGAGSIVLKDVPDNTTVVGIWGGTKQ